MEFIALALIVLSSVACFAAVGGCIASLKHRRPLEGFVLGATLGPIGLILELKKPFGHRPMVDRSAWNSFRSMVDYQSTPTLLQLTDSSVRAEHRRAS